MAGRGSTRGSMQPPVMRSPAIHVLAVFTVVVLGLNWPIMAIGVDSMPPLWLTAVRLLGAGLLMGCVLWLKGGLRLPSRQDAPIVWSVGVIRLALVWSLMFTALTFVPPGRSSVLVYTNSLWTAIIAGYFLRESLPPLRLIGVVAGVAGVVVMVEPWRLDLTSGGVALGYVMLLGAAIASAAGSVHVRGHDWKASPMELMPWQLTLAGLLTAVLATVVEGQPSLVWSPQEWFVVIYQVVFASAFGFWGVLTMGRSLAATTTNLLLMAVPVIGVASSVVLVDERLTLTLLVGMVLIFAGVATGFFGERRVGS